MAGQIRVKHREIYEHVHAGIVSGQYALGQQIPTEAELARRFDASRVTVARALRELEHRGLLVRRRGAGSFVSQVPRQTGQLLGMVAPESAGLFTMVTNLIARRAQQAGLGMLLGRHPSGDADQMIEGIDSLCRQFSEQRVGCVIFVPLALPAELSHINVRMIEAFDRCRIPVVLLDRDVYDFPRRSKYDFVAMDHLHTGLLATEHLLDQGYRRIGYWRHNREASSVTARVAGYREALLLRGIRPDPDWIAIGDATCVAFVRDYLDRAHPDAVVCVNDHEAARLMRTLAVLKVKVPDHLAITGVDNDGWATLLSVSLTTVRQPVAELASAAMELMLERMAEPGLPAREICLTGQLIVRQSSGAPLKPGSRKRGSRISGPEANEPAASRTTQRPGRREDALRRPPALEAEE